MGPQKIMDYDWTEKRVNTVAEMGELVRTIRKSQNFTQYDLSGLLGQGNRFISELKRGKPTVQLQKVMDVLALLGIDMVLRDKGLRGDPIPEQFWVRND